MPKPMKIMVEVEEVAFGRVFRTLDSMAGVASLTIVTDSAKVPGAKPAATGQKKGGAMTVACIVLGELARDQVRNWDWLRAAAVRNGKAMTSVPDAVAKLIKSKEIKRIGSGTESTFSITPKGKTHYETACQIQPAAGRGD